MCRASSALAAIVMSLLSASSPASSRPLDVYSSSFDGLSLARTRPFPGDPEQDNWYQVLAAGEAIGEIQDAVAVSGRALHEFAPASNGCGTPTADARNVTPPDLEARPIITLGVSFFCHTSDLDAMNPYAASLRAGGGLHPGYEIVGFGLFSGNDAPKGEMGVTAAVGYFDGALNAELPLTVGTGLAWDAWHRIEIAIDQAADTYVYVEVDGERQYLYGHAPPRSFAEGEWRRGQLIEGIAAEVVSCPWAPPNETDDDVYWDDLSLTVGVRDPALAEEIQESAAPCPRLELAGRHPASGCVALRYSLAAPATVRLGVFDSGGRLIRRLVDSREGPGDHGVSWDGRDGSGVAAPPGLYLVRLDAGGIVARQKIVRVR